MGALQVLGMLSRVIRSGCCGSEGSREPATETKQGVGVIVGV